MDKRLPALVDPYDALRSYQAEPNNPALLSHVVLFLSRCKRQTVGRREKPYFSNRHIRAFLKVEATHTVYVITHLKGVAQRFSQREMDFWYNHTDTITLAHARFIATLPELFSPSFMKLTDLSDRGDKTRLSLMKLVAGVVESDPLRPHLKFAAVKPLSLSKTRRLAEAWQSSDTSSGQPDQGGADDPNTHRFIEEVSEYIGRPIELQPSVKQSGGRITLAYDNYDDLMTLLYRLGYPQPDPDDPF